MDSCFVILLVLGALLGAQSTKAPKPWDSSATASATAFASASSTGGGSANAVAIAASEACADNSGCPENEHYVENCNRRERTCDDDDDSKTCEPRSGCTCDNGYLRDKSCGRCVMPCDCPPKKKCYGSNEVWKDCGTACPKTCDTKDAMIKCIDKCVSGCFCEDGYIRKVLGGECIRIKDCPPKKKCDDCNEVWKDCGTACPKTCQNKDDKIKCPLICVKGCFCKDGLIRSYPGGKCIRPEECPLKCYGPNEEYDKCGTGCPKTCKNKDLYMKCSKPCKEGCFCRNGFVRDDNWKCIDPDYCPCGCDDDDDDDH